MRDREEARKQFESKFLNDQSKFQHAEDVRHNKQPLGFQPRRKEEEQHPTSAAFEQRHRS